MTATHSRSPVRLLCLLLLALFAATLASGVAKTQANMSTESDQRPPVHGGTPVPSGWIPVQDPPATPPATVRIHTGGSGFASEALSAAGELLSYQWVVEGVLRSFEPELPIHWPEPILLTGDQIVIELGAVGVPMPVQVQFFRAVDDQGLPVGEPIGTWCAMTDGATGPGSPVTSADFCRVTRAPDGVWEVAVAVPRDPGQYYGRIWAAWPIPYTQDEATPRPSPADFAAWIFCIAR
jgi:hypothetical protein